MTSSNWLSHFIFLFLIHYCYIGFASAYNEKVCPGLYPSHFQYGLVHILTMDDRFLESYRNTNKSMTYMITAEQQVTMSQVWRVEKIGGYDDGRFLLLPFNNETAMYVRENKKTSNLILPEFLTEFDIKNLFDNQQQFILHNGNLKSIKYPDLFLTAPDKRSKVKHDNRLSLRYISKKNDRFSQKWYMLPMKEEYIEITKTKIFPQAPVVLESQGKFMDLQYDVVKKKYVVVANEKSTLPSSSQIWVMEKIGNGSLDIWHIMSKYYQYILNVHISSMETVAEFYCSGGMIKPVDNRNVVLTVKAHDIVFQNITGQANQIWSISKAPKSVSRAVANVDSSRKDDSGRNCPDIKESKLTYGLVNIKTIDGKYLDTFYDVSESKTFLVAADKLVTTSQIWLIQEHRNYLIIFPFQNYSKTVNVYNRNVNENDKLILWPAHMNENQQYIYEQGVIALAKHRNLILTAPTTTGSNDDIHQNKVFLKDIKKQCNQKWKIVPVDDSYMELINKGDLLNKSVVIKSALGYYLDVKYSFDNEKYYVVANGNTRKPGPLWKIQEPDSNKLYEGFYNKQLYIKPIGINEGMVSYHLQHMVEIDLFVTNANEYMPFYPKFVYDRGMIKLAVNQNGVFSFDHVDIINHKRNNRVVLAANTGDLNQMWSIFDAEAEYGSISAVQDEISEIKITAFQAMLIVGQNSLLKFETAMNKKANFTIYHDQRLIDARINSKIMNRIREFKSGLYKFDFEKFIILFKINASDTKSLPINYLKFYADINGRNFAIKYEERKEMLIPNCTQNEKKLSEAFPFALRFEGIIEAKNEFECRIHEETIRFSFQVLTVKPEIELIEYTYSPISGVSMLYCLTVNSFSTQTHQNTRLYYNGDLLISENEPSVWTKNASKPGTYRCVVSSKHGMDEASFKVTKMRDNFGDDDGVLMLKAKPYSKSVEIESTFNRHHNFSCKQGDKQMTFTRNIHNEKQFYFTIHPNNEVHCASDAGDDFIITV